ncbi:MAG: dihydroneopterin aldolase [Polyangiaceae bacterium]|nr:dihydroneopterin aldolase [Polyangiaceae bacterium]
MDWIRVDGLEVRCIVGLHSYERHRPQPLHLDIALGLDLSAAGRSGHIGDSADYARVADAITALLRFREYRLLEVAAEEAAAFLFALHPSVGQVKMRLDKPEALAGRARSAAIEIVRSRGAFGATVEAREFGTRTEILTSREALIETIMIAPGQRAVFEEPTPRLEAQARLSRFSDVPLPSPTVSLGGAKSEYGKDEESTRLVRCLLLNAEQATSSNP